MTTVNSEAERYADLALKEYRDSGSVPPKLIVSTTRDIEIVCVLARGRHPGDCAADVLARLNSLLDVELAVLITEAWHRTFKADDPAVRKGMPRGTLEAMHEAGDANVKTALTISVTDGLERTMRTIDADSGGPLLDDDEGSAQVTGYLTTVLIDAMRFGREQRKTMPPQLYLSLRALTASEVAVAVGGALAHMGLVEAVMLGTEFYEPKPEDN